MNISEALELRKELIDLTTNYDGLISVKEQVTDNNISVGTSNLGAMVPERVMEGIRNSMISFIDKEIVHIEDRLAKLTVHRNEEPAAKEVPIETLDPVEIKKNKTELSEEEMITKMKQYLKEGRTVTSIAKEFGMGKSKCYEILKRNSVSPSQYRPI